MAVIRLLLVDDHCIVRQGIRSLLELDKELVVVGEAASGTKALELIGELAPDVVLLDVRIPELDGVEVCRRSTAQHPAIPIIILTAFSAEESVLQCIRAGAKAYVLKDVDVVELASTIRAVHRGESVLDPKIVGAVMSEVRRAYQGHKDESTLNDREMEIVRFLSQGLTNQEIGWKMYLSPSTVKAQIRKVEEKLGVAGRTAIVYEASKRNLI